MFRHVFDDCRRWPPIVSRGSMPSFIQKSISIITREPVYRGFSNFLKINLRVHGPRFYTRIAAHSSAPLTTAFRYVISACSLLEKKHNTACQWHSISAGWISNVEFWRYRDSRPSYQPKCIPLCVNAIRVAMLKIPI